jgi:sporulation protein YlmC with PRC-barrel domain
MAHEHGDPVSWLLIEPGWKVYDASGEKVGRVEEVLGDTVAGIFHGIVVDGKEIDADQIGEIYEGDVHLSVVKEHVVFHERRARTS